MKRRWPPLMIQLLLMPTQVIPPILTPILRIILITGPLTEFIFPGRSTGVFIILIVLGTTPEGFPDTRSLAEELGLAAIPVRSVHPVTPFIGKRLRNLRNALVQNSQCFLHLPLRHGQCRC